MTTPRWRASILGVALALLTTGSAAATSTASDIERRAVEDPLFGVSSVVPADWQELGPGAYARGVPPADLALIAIQSAPVPVEQLWPSLLPQLRIDAVPEPTGELATESFDWTLYEVPVTMGEVAVTMELALAEDDVATHLILLQAASEEFPGLREQVLLPAIEAFAVLGPEPTPDPATLGYVVEEVGFPGGGAGVELAGTLTLPAGPGPHAAVVLMSGSGAQDRDESLRPVSTLKPFALIADALTSAGLAVLRYDDRGVGGSTGEYQTATLEDLAGDGAAALAFLRAREDIDPQRIGLLGHSEGGLYAAMLAAEDPDIAFVVGLAAPAMNGVDLIVAQNEALQRSSGAPDEEVRLAASFSAEAIPLARDGDEAGVEAALRDYLGSLWGIASEADRLIMGDRDAFIERQVDAQLATLLSDWFRSILAYDPGPDWQGVSAPVLGIFGGKDVQVLGEPNAEALRAALESGGNKDIQIVVLPDANHLFQSAESGAVGEYASLPPEFTPDLLPSIVTWLTEHLGIPGAS